MKKNTKYLMISLLSLSLTSCSIFQHNSSSSTSEKESDEVTSTTESSTSTSIDSESEETTSTTEEETSTTTEKQMTINDCKSTEQIDAYKENGYSPLFKDANFKNGFRVTKTFYESGESPYHDGEKLNFYDLTPDANTYDWTIAQWSSQYDLMGENGNTITSDDSGLVHTITSKGKDVDGQFVPAKQVTCDSLTGAITLTCNTSVEYEKARVSSDPWVHLLFEQSNFTLDGSLVNLSCSKSIIMEADYEVTKCDDMMNGEANANVHAAQLVWYITLQNLNKSSKGYGKYIWFGLGLFDNRTAGKQTTLYSQYDKGTSTGIYSPSSTTYLNLNDGKIPTVGQRVKAQIDILTVTKAAYEEGKNKGYFDDTEYEDLAIGGMNFGYEVPGTYDISTNIYAINIFAK